MYFYFFKPNKSQNIAQFIRRGKFHMANWRFIKNQFQQFSHSCYDHKSIGGITINKSAKKYSIWLKYSIYFLKPVKIIMVIKISQNLDRIDKIKGIIRERDMKN